jgi:hypothetical protein
VLIALVTPWLLMFAILGQMDGRYLLYGACATAVAIAVNPGLTLLHLLVTIMNGTMMLIYLLRAHRRDLPDLNRLLAPLEPGLGWALLLATAIFLYFALTSGPKLDRPPSRT